MKVSVSEICTLMHKHRRAEFRFGVFGVKGSYVLNRGSVKYYHPCWIMNGLKNYWYIKCVWGEKSAYLEMQHDVVE